MPATSTVDSSSATYPTKVLLLISLVQGLLLLLLHQAIDLKYWPYPQLNWLYSMYAMVLIGPTIMLLCMRNAKLISVLKLCIPFTFVAGAVAFYIGSQVLIPLSNYFNSLLFTLAITLFIATFKAIIYIQQFSDSKSISYSELFLWSWRSFLTISFSFLFCVVFYGILMLCAALFKAININFFFDLFTEKWFFYPAISLANGFAIILIRNMSHLLDVVTRLQQALMKFLLVMLVAVSLMFLIALPYSGLAPLWEKGGSALVLWLQAIMLFFLNAVYQDTPDKRPYTLWLHRFIYIGIALLPIYSLIGLYGLSLRVSQYGLTVERCWALFIWLFLALFSFSYMASIFVKRDNWMSFVNRINIHLGLVLLLAMLLVNSPLLDFRKLTVQNQLARLQANKIQLDQFSVRYFARELHKPGVEALKELQSKYKLSNPEFSTRVENALSRRTRADNVLTETQFKERLEIVSGNLPEDIENKMYLDLKSRKNTYSSLPTRLYVYEVTMSNEQTRAFSDYVVVEKRDRFIKFYLYSFINKQWKKIKMNPADYNYNRDEIITALLNKEVKTVEPRWKTLEIGNTKIMVRE